MSAEIDSISVALLKLFSICHFFDMSLFHSAGLLILTHLSFNYLSLNLTSRVSLVNSDLAENVCFACQVCCSDRASLSLLQSNSSAIRDN